MKLNKGIIAIILILLIAIVGISAYAISNKQTDKIVEDFNNSTDNPIIVEVENNTTNGEMPVTNENNTTVSPPTGYKKINLGGLDFYIEDKYLNSDDLIMFDTFPNGKNYGISKEDAFPAPNKDYARLTAYVTDFTVNIALNPDYVEEISIPSKTTSSKDITVDGKKVKIIHTTKDHQSQSIDGEVSAAYFKIGDKYIYIIWKGNQADKNVIESFLKLNS
ncbi:hypothetical protein [Methanobrevibacter filiformis]|uniref:DUF4367 domain-containing protein n=1 Tax=Methanobrevibacter filiformis TaxID=55758 RepID=A0A166A454_9EURY|nr:hypothetical protein [Methanobrevibacter filiformis]KZX11539.1 hypothetical protein MBFIL_14150 [Methanobrevibacter filiformis]